MNHTEKVRIPLRTCTILFIDKAVIESSYKYNYYIKKLSVYPANNYLFKVSNRNSRKRCEICSMLTRKKRKW